MRNSILTLTHAEAKKEGCSSVVGNRRLEMRVDKLGWARLGGPSKAAVWVKAFSEASPTLDTSVGLSAKTSQLYSPSRF